MPIYRQPKGNKKDEQGPERESITGIGQRITHLHQNH
jgi:hypothetical protein